jgi:mRNA interferase YafQ
MRTILRTRKFKRDVKRVRSGANGERLYELLLAVVALLIEDLALPLQNRDHALTGTWNDHRDCHIRPDLVLIYRKPDDDTLELVRLGSHSELGI